MDVIPRTLVDLLRRRAAAQPECLAYVFLQNGENEGARLTYAELDRQARAAAAVLQQRRAAGERAVLLFTPGLEFLSAFFGCLYAGVVAVPSYPPRPGRFQPRLRAIASDSRPRFALANAPVMAKVPVWAAGLEELEGVEWLAAEEILEGPAAEWVEPELEPGTLAFLQYTSGSTSDPKGVMVSHGNLLANEEMIRASCFHTAESTFVSWLPMYHDMGLIGSILQPLYIGAPCVLMSPAAFLHRPLRWLQAISRYRAHTSGAPNFAYDLCARKIATADRERLDLSSWKVAFNGAEPVRASTVEAFSAAFAPAGFRPEGFFPCYGLAEATLIVSGLRRPEPPRVAAFAELDQGRAVAAGEGKGRPLVSCGPASPGLEIAIVNPETLQERAPGEIGEIWVSGPSVAQGYWRRAEDSERWFRARIAGDRRERTFLRTGDLGFLHAGELIVVGRLKDLIILRGRNLYPQDLEATSEASHPVLRAGGAAAFSVDAGGEERLVLVQELERRSTAPGEEVAEAIRRAVAEEHEAEVHEVVLVQADSVPKTSSGKVQRQACRARHLAGELPVLWRGGPAAPAAEPAGALEAPGRAALLAAPVVERRSLLAAWLWRQTGRRGLPGPERPLVSLGLDSLQVLELQQRIEDNLGVSLPVSELFEAPGLGGLADRVLELWEGSRAPGAVPLEPVGAAEGDHPLSAGQKALWFVDRLAPESAVYNLAVAGVWRGLVPERLQDALSRLTGRHPALRTTFVTSGGAPVQRVHPQLEPEFLCEDAAGWDPGFLRSRLAAEAWRPFDLAAGPLVRAAVFALSPGEHAVVLATHHLVADFWSLAVVLRELGELDEARPLAPLRLRFTDVVRWQERRLAGEEGERLWAYWRQRLSGDRPGSLPVLDLPTDRPRSMVQTYLGSACHAALDEELTLALRGLSHARGATLFMTLLAGFLTLLQRYTGQEDLLVGSPAAGRAGRETAGLVGYFVQPLVLRSDLSGDPAFGDLLGQVRRTVSEAFAHQDFPLALLVERLHPVRDPARSPLFQVMFTFQSTPFPEAEGIPAFTLGGRGARLRVGSLELESLPLEESRAPFDLTLTLAEVGDRLGIHLQLNRELFDPATGERMIGHLRILLAAAAADPDQPVRALPMLTGAEREQTLRGWNGTVAEIPEPPFVHELVAMQAERSPDSPAVELEGRSWTYGELLEQSRRLAHHLRRLGVSPETRVGILLERSLEMVASLLAVLEAGGAYVPLDPIYPAGRLELMLQDSGAPVVITTSRLAGLLPAAGARQILLEEEREAVARESAAPLRRVSEPESLAYVIYTSGSTGRPKGVQIPHRALANLLGHMRRTLRPGPDDVLLSVTTLSFDIAALELFLPLISGARLVLVRRDTAADGMLLARAIASSGATLMQATPATWRLLVETGWQGSQAMTALCGGEALPRELARQLLARTVRLWNVYGPTETTIWSSAHRVSDGDGPVPLGDPLANTQLYVLDRRMEPVPERVVGGLHIGGAGLARGYLHRPDLTAAAFLPDPWSAHPDARLYRTGDLARWSRAHGIEFLGRGDTQVKVRGFRIELGEIEAALEGHPAVAQAVALVREDRPGDRRLVAYFVPRAGAAFKVPKLRSHLRGLLPEHSVPSSLVLLPVFPFTPNGKVDRLALPAPEEGRAEAGPALPRGPVQQVLATLWCELLGLECVAADESFFELGGHSLLGVRLLARVREALQVELPLSSLFEAPTVETLAERVLAARGQVPALTLRPVARAAELPLSSGQSRLWFLHQLAPSSPAYHIALALELEGPLDVGAMAAGCAEVTRRHEALRTTFQRRPEGPVQVVSPPPEAVHLPVLDLAALPEAAEALIQDEVRRPFELSRGPLARLLLVRLAPERHRLILTVHHIVADGGSLELVVRELGTLYAGFAAGRGPVLADPPLQQGDFVVWQRRWLAEGRQDPGLAYWRRQLADLPAALKLPVDRPRSPVQSFEGGTLPVDLPGSLLESLFALGRRRGATRFIVLLAGFQALLQRWAGQSDVAVGSPFFPVGAGLDGAVGLFVNTVVLRTRGERASGFLGWLDRVRETCVGAYEHQDVPFEGLVEELQTERDLSRNPLFQTLLVLDRLPTTATVAGLTVRPRLLSTATAKVDLSLYLVEQGEGFTAALEYSSALFDASTILRLAGHLRTLLEGVVASPGRELEDLPLLIAAERAQLLTEWNDTAWEGPGEACLHELFEAQVERAPEAPAVVFEGSRLSYAELARRAHRLARHLERLGVGLETVVGICAERSLELVVGLLGILEAGGAYLPLDPGYPRDRMAYMLENARVDVVLSQEKLYGLLPPGPLVLDLDASWEEAGRAPDRPPVRRALPDNPAYVIYTSGSTGRPKGVMVPHRGICNRLLWMQAAYGLTSDDRVLQKTPFSFDVSVWELFWPLITGACLVVARPGAHQDSAELARLVAAERITTIHFVPSMLAAFLAEEDLSGCAPLRRVICSGEALPPDLAGRALRRLGSPLHNLYGPTEASVDVTAWPCTPADLRTVPIGRPISALRTHVLDARMQPVPIGIPGQLFLGGVGLARGYVNRPDLTADRFVPDPWSEVPGERLYRTGDLARYRPDGALEFLGRLDHQAKIRGFRIELGEIEAVLGQHPAVTEAVAVVYEDSRGERRLSAYFTAGGEPPTVPELRAYLGGKLPEYMVPADLVFLERLPLSANGKVDRRALPAPGTARPEPGEGILAPRTPLEEILAAVWAQVLGRDAIGVRDSFFELGGDSLRSLRVRSLARAKGLDLSLQQIFTHRTVEELALAARRVEETGVPRVEPFGMLAAEDLVRLPEGLEDAFPLAMLQEGLVFHSEYSADYEVYVTSFRLRARFDAEALCHTLDQLVRRHAMLRTSFDLTGFTEPVQRVHREATFPLVIEDLRALDPEAREERLAAWSQTERRTRFDWSRPPFARLHVHRLDDETFHLALVHCLFDGWSMSLLAIEMLQGYLALLRGEPPAAQPSLAASYRDFVALERAVRRSPEARAFWAEKLAGTELARSPRWGRPPGEGEDLHIRRMVEVPPETLRGLQSLARSLAVPLKSVLIAGHVRVVGMLTGQTDVLAGLLANGRPEEADGDRVLGLFLNAVPLRLDLSGDTWAGLVQRAFDAERELLPFRRFPLAELHRDRGGAVFETVFNFTHFHAFESLRSAAGLEVLEASTPSDQTYFPLTVYFNLNLESSRLHLAVDSDTRELCPEQAERIIEYHLAALGSMASDPDARFELAGLLPDEERRQMLWGWSHPWTELPGTLVHQLFEAQAARTPDAPAVADSEGSWTYAELDARAGRLARFLRALGVGPEVRVGICLPRSRDLLASVLGVLKASGAYLPLDPAFPAERLAYMVTDSRARVLVTLEGLLNQLPHEDLQTLCLDRDADLETGSAGPLAARAAPGNAAYVIYTSGSTGRPKGVIVPHSGVVNFLLSMQREPGMDAGETLLAVTSLSFDIAVLELFLPLSLGGRVHLAGGGETTDGERLRQILEQEGIAVMQATPATWRLLLEADWPGTPGLRAFCGGEALTRDLAEALLARTAELWNLYGPTETTIWSMAHRVEGGRAGVPLGRPVANTEVYILDRHGMPVPPGVPGEIFLGGAGVVRGYSGRPDLTAERFVPDPFSDEAGARLYRTGDLASRSPGGEIEFLGRLDDQVKIRGFRIELGEIESVLAEHPAVRQAAVAARRDAPGEARLVAYVVPAPDRPAPGGHELREFLRRCLPEHMLPAAFVPLEALPLTANRKLDRRALPDPAGRPVEGARSRVPPRDVLELQLARMWEEVLGVSVVMVTDSFFELGGHSLLAMRLTGRIRQRFQRDLPVNALLQAATVERLAALLRGQADAAGSALVEIQPRGRRAPFFCVHPIGGNVLCYAELSRALGTEQPFYAFQAPELVGREAPRDLAERAAVYVEALRKLLPGGPYRLGGWSMGAVIAFEMAQQLLQAGESVELLALIDASCPAGSGLTGTEEEEEAVADWFARDLAGRAGLQGAELPAAGNGGSGNGRGRGLSELLETARSSGILPADLGAAEIQGLFDLFKRNLAALRRYVPQPYPGRILLVRAAEMAAPEPTLGWHSVAAGGIELQELPGDHYSLMRAPCVERLARILEARLGSREPAAALIDWKEDERELELR